LLFPAYYVYGGSCTNSIDKTLIKLINLSHGDDACDFGIQLENDFGSMIVKGFKKGVVALATLALSFH
jgi:hypothetical protein